ncbi:MAG TPA: PC4/YdbC family ssDNA-binding protein [Rectinemataceae bacterium]|nr:PC4/YdbC family ssDNA-binding protein [Rectinemataceae bacterium]
MENKEITFEIVRHIGVVSEGGKGWRKELNLVSWNGREAKIDLREWSQDHLHMGKGVTLTQEEGVRVAELLSAHVKGL